MSPLPIGYKHKNQKVVVLLIYKIKIIRQRNNNLHKILRKAN